MGCQYHLRYLSCHLMLLRPASPSMLAQLAHNSYWFPGFLQPRRQKSQTQAPPAQRKIAALPSIHSFVRGADRSTSLVHSQFVRGVFAPGRDETSRCFSDTRHSAFASRPTCSCPSSVDPTIGLHWTLWCGLCTNTRVSATVVRITKCDIQADISAPEAAHIGRD